MKVGWFREMYTPKISIVIPAYNASNYLAEAIDSALAQTYPNVEVIVVNDGSNDNGATERVALSYGNRIRYFYKENGGSSSALNMGIANMTGEWFSWLSHDDLYLPEKLEKQVDKMEQLLCDGAALSKHIFFSAVDLINAEGKTIRASRLEQSRRLSDKVDAFAHNGYLIAEPTVYNFCGCSCLIHKEAFADIGYFDEALRLINDLDFWYRLYSANYVVHYLPEALVKCRIHSAQVSKSIGYSYRNAEQDMFWTRTLEYLTQNCSEEDVLFYRFGRNAYLKTRNVEADAAFTYLTARKPSRRMKLTALKLIYKGLAGVRGFAKKIYLKLKT
ncbi:MAG: glycosyltransferase [Oscillospiraceae bacterium]|nr:glycosyltransferase [Oscillospiraceae bacterium]